MINFIGLVFKCLCLLILFPSPSYSFECTKSIDKISKDYNLSILCKNISYKISNKDISGIEPSESLKEEFVPSLISFLSSYNKNFISSVLKELVLKERLNFIGSPVGGLSSGDRIYIDLDAYSEKNRLINYTSVLHHEFSSKVFNKSSHSKRLIWRNIHNTYDYSMEYIKKCMDDPNFARMTTETNLRNGFINNYSITNSENDFNVFAEYLFTNDARLAKYIKKYEKIKIKINLLKEMYRESGYTGDFNGY